MARLTEATDVWRALRCCALVVVLAGCADSGVTVGDGEVSTPTQGADDAGATPEQSSDNAVPTLEQGSENGPPFSLTPHDDAFRSEHYSGSAQCRACHDGLTDELGNDVSLVEDWSASLMANSARDPYWLAKVAYELAINPTISDELNDSCSRCHAPMANDAAIKAGAPQSILGPDGLLAADNPWFDHAMDGVSCTLCHQVADDGLLGTPEGTSGGFFVEQKTIASERPAYGQYTDPADAFMTAQVAFRPQYGAHLTTSASCGACHDLRVPVVDESGNYLDGVGNRIFPEQMIFTEWRNSVYAQAGSGQEQRCQDCHMPQVPGSVRLATRGGGMARENFARHTFLGPNTVMQTMLMNHRDELGIQTPVETFERSIVRNRAFMQASASIAVQNATLREGQLDARVIVRHASGHKLPSGFISRRVFVHLVVTDAAGEIVFESGRPNPDGSIVGLDGDADPQAVEPHHDLITDEDQVQVYEAVMRDNASQVVHSLVRASGYIKDNRLLPQGMNKAQAPDEIAVAGGAVNDPDFDSGGDVLNVQIALSGTGPVTVTAELIYQPLAYGHLQDLFSKAAGPEVSTFETWHDEQPLKVEVLSSSTVQVVP